MNPAATPYEPLTEEELSGLRSSYDDPPPMPTSRRVLPLEDEPSSLVARYLFPTERFRGEWKRHAVHPAKGLAVVGLFWAAGVWVAPQWAGAAGRDSIVAAFSAAAVLLGVACLGDWYFDRFVLTNKRLMLVRGLVTRRVDTVALPRVTDLRFRQSALGRLLGFGTLRVAGVGWRNGLHKVVAVPSPNELYLRVTEERYEPQAVEARLGRGVETEDDSYDDSPAYEPPAAEPPTQQLDDVPLAVTAALQDVLLGPALVNYDGWVSVEVLHNGRPVATSPGRRVSVEPGNTYDVVVTISAQPHSPLAERLVVSDGVDLSHVEFTAELDSDRAALRHAAVDIVVARRGAGRAVFRIDVGPRPVHPPPWLWIRVAQEQRIIQSIELELDYGEPPALSPRRRGSASG